MNPNENPFARYDNPDKAREIAVGYINSFIPLKIITRAVNLEKIKTVAHLESTLKRLDAHYSSVEFAGGRVPPAWDIREIMPGHSKERTSTKYFGGGFYNGSWDNGIRSLEDSL